VSALEAELDALFALHPEAMVEARNALAQRLRKAGDKENAERIKALKRPTASAWALNQLHQQEPEQFTSALACAERVRALHAQANVDRDALRNAAAAQRQAIHELVEHALLRVKNAGLPHGLAQQKKLLATVQGWLAGVGDEPPGRMTHDLEPPGFAGVGSVGTVDARPPSPATFAQLSDKRAREPAEDTLARRLEEARAQLSDARQESARVEKLLKQRASEEKSTALGLEALRERVREAERALSTLRESERAEDAQLRRVAALHREARAEHERSVQALEAATRAVDELERGR
jgi:hypothetical protein